MKNIFYLSYVFYFLSAVQASDQLLEVTHTNPEYHTKESLIAQKKTTTSQKGTIPSKLVGSHKEFAVIATLPLHGEISIAGKQVQFGTNLYFDKLKKEAAKHTLPLCKYFFLDNYAEARRARSDVKDLTKRSPALLNLFGTEIIVALDKQLAPQGLASFFPLEGLDALRKQTAQHSIFLRASYKQELRALIDYSVKTLNQRKIALFYEASDFGEGILASFKTILKEYDLEPAATGSYPEKTVNISPAIPLILKGGPNTIICASGARPAYNFISQMINKGMHRCTFLGLSPIFSIQKTLLKSRGVRIITSSVVPDPFRSTLPIAQEYRADMKKYLPNKTVNPYSFEGYINAALFVDAINTTKGPITTRTVMATLEAYKNRDFKGLSLSFDPVTRSLHSTVWLSSGDGKEWVKVGKS